jgi:hypothetical protein
VIGAFSDGVAALMAETLAGMSIGRVLVIHGHWAGRGDARGPVHLLRRPARVDRARACDSRDYGCPSARSRTCAAATPRRTSRLRAALEGGDTAAHRNALILGAALALEVTGHVLDAHAGVARARSARERSGTRPRGARRRVRPGAREVSTPRTAPMFLERMAATSRARVARARAAESDAKLARRAQRAARAPALKLDRFDVIAELKLRSPAAGGLADGSFDQSAQLAAYARGGAAAVSVLTEPTEFKGELAHLEDAAARLKPAKIPAMRKDFVTDPYQVLEARAAARAASS